MEIKVQTGADQTSVTGLLKRDHPAKVVARSADIDALPDRMERPSLQIRSYI
ncbi:hypothetical protein PY092_14445 [Muricauda sp. 334s03]|uniref:Uncharacterized protein n=1 Tax=Flagellimonas yonaguniensis TaxID=3031325 RepID=A0ABT5Y1P6_9FLAO|nr:hypothetical protein [[Muricauda] yonaguniensis]MDF0717360.1 hypothetical protein [[Muricauda] yonaguniensis]